MQAWGQSFDIFGNVGFLAIFVGFLGLATGLII